MSDTAEHRRHIVRERIGKAAELLALGLLFGVASLALSFLWKAHVFKAADMLQYFTVEPLPYFAHSLQERLPFKMVVLDIGEATCRQWAEKDYQRDLRRASAIAA